MDAVPVKLVTVPLEGTPRAGVINVGELLSTTAVDPVDAVTPVPPFATGSVPVSLATAIAPSAIAVELPLEVTIPVRLALVVTVAALPVILV